MSYWPSNYDYLEVMRVEQAPISDTERLTAELALRLSNAWVKYRAAFGGEPRGTERQMAALLQLAGIERFFSDRHKELDK